jgi:hypothetical protein
VDAFSFTGDWSLDTLLTYSLECMIIRIAACGHCPGRQGAKSSAGGSLSFLSPLYILAIDLEYRCTDHGASVWFVHISRYVDRRDSCARACKACSISSVQNLLLLVAECRDRGPG